MLRDSWHSFKSSAFIHLPSQPIILPHLTEHHGHASGPSPLLSILIGPLPRPRTAEPLADQWGAEAEWHHPLGDWHAGGRSRHWAKIRHASVGMWGRCFYKPLIKEESGGLQALITEAWFLMASKCPSLTTRPRFPRPPLIPQNPAHYFCSGD
ncbi:hypothetical protein AOLI_G00245530 [Acnodon oligacanthus]